MGKKNKRRPRQVTELFVTSTDADAARAIMTGGKPANDTPASPTTVAVLNDEAWEYRLASLMDTLRPQLPSMSDDDLRSLAEELLGNVLMGIARRQSS